jgi:hypothetical protein
VFNYQRLINETKRIETKRNETKRNETKRNETKRNETKRNETKRNRTKQNESERNETKRSETKRKKTWPGKPSSDTHDQIRKITLKTTIAKTTTFNRKMFGICLREKTLIDYVICTVIPKVIIT